MKRNKSHFEKWTHARMSTWSWRRCRTILIHLQTRQVGIIKWYTKKPHAYYITIRSTFVSSVSRRWTQLHRICWIHAQCTRTPLERNGTGRVFGARTQNKITKALNETLQETVNTENWMIACVRFGSTTFFFSVSSAPILAVPLYLSVFSFLCAPIAILTFFR